VLTTTKFDLNTDVVYALVVTAVFATVIARFLQNWLQKYTRPSDAAVIFSMEGVFAHLCAVIMLGESLNLQQYVGAFLILFAVILVSCANHDGMM
jgi:drug/metabolite transporter (DMT)-like permease